MAAPRKPERMSKADLLEAVGRKLKKEELVSMLVAVNHGWRPYTGMHYTGEQVEALRSKEQGGLRAS